MKCPNNCGELIELEKPALVPPTEEAIDILSQHDGHFYYLIYRICPKCGYHEGKEINEKQFEELTK